MSVNKTKRRGWTSLRVTDVIEETHDTKTIFLVDEKNPECPFDYIAGQYMTFRFDGVEAKPVVRSYTLSSCPNEEPFVAFTVKRVEKGLISNWLCDNISPGDIMKARGPIGKFYYDHKEHCKNLVMIAAGSGVTPFISILKQYASAEKYPGINLTLIVSYRSTKDLILWDDIEALRKQNHIDIFITLTRESAEGFLNGRPTPEMVSQLLKNDYKDKTFMTCGPEKLMEMVTTNALENGVSPESILTESFD